MNTISRCTLFLVTCISQMFAEPSSFDYALFNAISKQDTNEAYSPFALSALLATLSVGTTGETEAELLKVLPFPEASLDKSYQKLLNKLNKFTIKDGDDSGIKWMGVLWLQKGLLYSPLYQNKIVSSYQATLKQIDFIKTPKDTAKTINRWMNKKTQGRMATVVNPKEIEATTQLIALTTFYLKSPLAKPFSYRQTKGEPFFPSTGASFPHPFMHQKALFPYLKVEGASLIELPYEKNSVEIGLIAILPDAGVSLEAIKKRLTTGLLNQFETEKKEVWIDLAFPRFQIRSPLSLKKPLQEVGISLIFSQEANFSHLSDTVGLRLDELYQDTFFIFDENGTEAGLNSPFTPKEIPETVTVAVNRPFIFAVVEHTTNSLLLLGQITRPAEPTYLYSENVLQED